MALPSIASPQFTLILPSTGKKFSYRPFLVKEEKILLIALEGGNPDDIINSIKEIIRVCVFGIDVEAISIFDLEYCFLRLREKSISDKITIFVKHIDGINSDGNPCDHTQEILVDLSLVDIVKTEGHDKKIQLTDEIGVVMKYPTLSILNELGNYNSNTSFSIIADCIDYIYDADKTYPSLDYKKEEITAFVDNLTHTQLEKIEYFFETLPKVSYEVKWKCGKCKVEETIVLEGLTDFFT